MRHVHADIYALIQGQGHGQEQEQEQEQERTGHSGHKNFFYLR